MTDQTLAVIKAALAGDPTLDPEKRRHLLSLLRNGEATKAETKRQLTRGFVKRKSASEALGVSLRYVDILIEKGALKKVQWPGCKRAVGVTRESLETLLANGGGE